MFGTGTELLGAHIVFKWVWVFFRWCGVKLCVLIDVHPRHIQPNLDVTHWICFFFFYIVTPCRSTFINIGMLASTRRLVLLDMGNLVCFVGVHGSLWGIFLSLLFRQITQIYIYQFLS